MSGSFADSNVLLYFSSPDPSKSSVVEGLLADGLTISVQVLNEIANVVIKKWKRSWDEADDLLATVRRSTRVVAVEQSTHELGVAIAKRHKLSIYDSMIAAAALLDDCETLYSQDMHPGLLIAGRLKIINPFAAR
jgi:predicted nucleic acid-binding protein